jgi:tRNA nucleotidyltransferase (CCA-adding enzyme)
MRFPAAVNDIFKIFKKNGFQAYAVGGCVRDDLLQKPSYDYDIATDALPEETVKIFHGFKVVLTGLKHGTVTVIAENMPVEITTFRTEGPYLDNRRPSEVYYSKKIEEDLMRRDFTINAIAYRPGFGYVDLFDGKKDLESRLIRCVGDPDARFGEDALRLLRALRLAAELGFDIENETGRSIHANRALLKSISAERINAEFTRLLLSGRAEGILIAYRDVCEVFLPEIKSIPAFNRRAGLVDQTKDLSIKLALLLQTKKTGPQNADPKDALKRLKYDSRTILKTDCLVKHCGKPVVAKKKQIKIWMNILGKELFYALLELKSLLEGSMQAQKDIADKILLSRECYSLKCLSVNGEDLIKKGIAEGKEVGAILKALLFDVIMERLPNEKDALLKRAETLHDKNKETGGRFD